MMSEAGYQHIPMPPHRDYGFPPADKLLARCLKAENGCLIWLGPLSKSGQAYTGHDPRFIVPRVLFCKHYKISIPTGVRLFRTCMTEACVAPEHRSMGTGRVG